MKLRFFHIAVASACQQTGHWPVSVVAVSMMMAPCQPHTARAASAFPKHFYRSLAAVNNSSTLAWRACSWTTLIQISPNKNNPARIVEGDHKCQRRYHLCQGVAPCGSNFRPNSTLSAPNIPSQTSSQLIDYP